MSIEQTGSGEERKEGYVDARGYVDRGPESVQVSSGRAPAPPLPDDLAGFC